MSSSTPPPSSAAEEKSLGNAAFQSKDFDKAIDHFSRAISLSPDDHVLYSNRSGAYASKEDFAKALADAQKCVELKKDWPKGYVRLGLAYLKLGKLEEAHQAYSDGLQFDENNASLKEGLQHVAAMTGGRERLAINPGKIAALVELDPRFAHLRSDKAFLEELQKALSDTSLLQQKLQTDERYADLIMASLDMPGRGTHHESPPTQPSYTQPSQSTKSPEPKKDERTDEQKEGDRLKDEGNELYKKRKFDEALAKYDEALQANPNEILYQGNKAAVYLEMGDYDGCLNECRKALERRYEVKADYEKVAKIYSRMAACYTKQKKFDEAIQCYEKALCEDNNRHTRTALADCKRTKEKYEAEMYLDPDKAEQHRLKGNELFKTGDYPNAKKEYDEAIRRSPNDARLYSNRAACLCKLLAYPSALSDCDKAIELDPTFVKAHNRKGFCELHMKEHHKALQSYQTALKIDPANDEAKQGLEEVLYKIQETSHSDKVDEEQAQKALQDPEIQQILADPQMQIILQQMSTNPATARQAMMDPQISARVQKLAAAGILRMR